MTNEEKAREIAKTNCEHYAGYLGVNADSFKECKASALRMAEWKDEHFAKIAKRVYADLLSAQGYNVAIINSELERLEAELKTASCSKKSNN